MNTEPIGSPENFTASPEVSVADVERVMTTETPLSPEAQNMKERILANMKKQQEMNQAQEKNFAYAVGSKPANSKIVIGNVAYLVGEAGNLVRMSGKSSARSKHREAVALKKRN